MYYLIHNTWERQGRRLGDLLRVTKGLWGPIWLDALTPSGDPGSPTPPRWAGRAALVWGNVPMDSSALLCPAAWAGRRSWGWLSWGPSPPLPMSIPVESRPPAWVGLALQQPSLGQVCSSCGPDGEMPQGKLL